MENSCTNKENLLYICVCVLHDIHNFAKISLSEGDAKNTDKTILRLGILSSLQSMIAGKTFLKAVGPLCPLLLNPKRHQTFFWFCKTCQMKLAHPKKMLGKTSTEKSITFRHCPNYGSGVHTSYLSPA